MRGMESGEESGNKTDIPSGIMFSWVKLVGRLCMGNLAYRALCMDSVSVSVSGFGFSDSHQAW